MRLGSGAALICLVVAGGNLSAQARLTGTVRDTIGAPIAGAEVFVEGMNGLVTTNRNGVFEFRGIMPGPATVTVRRLAYAPQTMVVKFVDGDNTLPDVVLTMVPRQLDTVMTREQQLWRERPLLREMEENRKVGLGQFVGRAELATQQGGFLSPLLNQKRGLVVVRDNLGSGTWLANKYIPNTNAWCYELEEKSKYGANPGSAACNYCFPTVYLDYARLSSERSAVNVGRFSPDQLEAMEIYLGAAETPARYASGFSGCGVIVLHTRAVDAKRRIIAAKQAHPTRSPVFANISYSAGARCFACKIDGASEVNVGYTWRDRWVIAARHASWNTEDGGPQQITLNQAVVEWYPKRDPGRIKWFLNAGAGVASVDINITPDMNLHDRFVGNTLPSVVMGTGVDFAVLRRFVVTPVLSYSRTVAGSLAYRRCSDVVLGDGSRELQCGPQTPASGAFTLRQVGLRFGWR